MSSDRILILGGSSFIGRHLFEKIGPQKALVTYCNSPLQEMFHFNSLTMDLTDFLKKEGDFSHCVILLGDSQPISCIANIRRSKVLNVESIKQIIDILSQRNIRCVFTSSNYVFDGIKGMYEEKDHPCPILVYGQQKFEIEKYLMENNDNYLILRLDKVYGDTPGDKTLFTSWIDFLLAGGKTIKCAFDQRFTPVWIQNVVSGIMALIEENCSGIYHIAGSKRYTRLELLNILLSTLSNYVSLDTEVIPCKINSFNLPEKWPVDVSLNTDKIDRMIETKFSDAGIVCKKVVAKYFLSKW